MRDGLLFKLFLGKQVAEAPVPVEIDDSRCVRALAADASCTRCGDACPRDAIAFPGSVPALDAGNCDGCSLCVPSCPQRAIVGQGAPIACGKATLFAACQRVASVGQDGVLPCLHALGAEDLIRGWLEGVRELRIANGQCNECERNTRQRLDHAVMAANAILESRGLEKITVSAHAMKDWRTALAAARRRQEVRPERRRFLRSGLNALADFVAPVKTEAVAASWIPSAALLPETKGAVFAFVPGIDELACTACDACLRLCPTGALAASEDYEKPEYAIRPALCTGCALCRDVCQENAIHVDEMCTARQTSIPLSKRLCQACGASHLAPVEESNDGLCRICRKTQRHRLLYQVIDTQ